MALEIVIPSDSRYKDTGVVFVPAVNKRYFEMWERPEELSAMIDNADRFIVRRADIGRLDLLADEYYSNVNLWWIIAAVNNLVDPIEDMVVGQRLFIPAYEDVISLISRPSHVVTQEDALP